MSAQDHLRDLLTGLGSARDDVDALLQDGDDAWAVLFSDGAALDVRRRDDASGLARFEIALGRPAEEERLACFEAALRVNAQWREQQGLRLSLPDPEQDLLLSIELPALLLDPVSLEQLVEALRARAAGWHEWLAGPADAAPPPLPELPAFALRV